MSYKIEDIPGILDAQRKYFASNETKNVKFRITQLKKLLAAVKKNEQALYDALWTDLHKCEPESFLCETSIVTGEIRDHIKHLKRWARTERAHSPLSHFPSTSKIIKEPLGNSLIIAPWNYPVTLLLCPLVGAISSGCTAVLKPSPYVPNVSNVLTKIIEETFDSKYVAIIQGHRDVNMALLEQRWDIIFFTGSPDLGKKVMAAAAKHLTPVVLELGGKSPCIVDKNANIQKAAMRVAWGKTLNCGQTCIAPDYLLLHKDIKDEFVKEFQNALKALHGENIKESPYFVRMVSEKAFNRVTSYFKDGKIIAGGHSDAAERYIEPTLLENVSPDAPIMTEEIFGPVFPIIEFTNIEEVVKFVKEREKPLAFYYYGDKKTGWKVLNETSSGGACINDCIMHFANSNLPFGGVGNSGMGHYHGKLTFEAFTHRRAVIDTPTWIDLPFRYMPYKFIGLMKKILG
ncbi:MAG: aldehyde dehydrogenase [Bacteroidales bacterium]|nr:aldehyde dehydrogenase [Bacteroidales bacterium]